MTTTVRVSLELENPTLSSFLQRSSKPVAFDDAERSTLDFHDHKPADDVLLGRTM